MDIRITETEERNKRWEKYIKGIRRSEKIGTMELKGINGLPNIREEINRLKNYKAIEPDARPPKIK